MLKDQRSDRPEVKRIRLNQKGSDKRLPLTQPTSRNTYGRVWKSHESKYPILTLVANAHIIINIEEH